jgi:GxxExxY protein
LSYIKKSKLRAILEKKNDRGGVMTENELSAVLVDICVDIHKKLGPGLLESVYESILVYELDRRGMAVERQVPMPLVWDGIVFEESFRADIVLDKKVIVEVKALEQICPVHLMQVLTYLRVSGYKLGMLVNFGCRTMKDGIRRIAYNLAEDGSLFVSE